MAVNALCLEAQPVERVWGGQYVSSRLGIPSPRPIGEVWLAYDQNSIKTGLLAGQTLAKALLQLGPDFIGEVPYRRYGLELPLLVKFLDAAQWLSVQVHPGDAYAHSVEASTGFHGKTEAWYILQGQGEIVYGLNRAVDRDSLETAAQDGRIWGMLHREGVGPGQVIYLPAGIIHALGPGLVLYEVQQRSDLTYRLYDFGRPRELHLGKGLDVARLTPTPVPAPRPLPLNHEEILLASQAFVLQRHRLPGVLDIKAPEESFLLLTLITKEADWAEGKLGWGDTLLVGAGQTIELQGQAEFLGAFVPSSQTLWGYPPSLRV